MVITRDSGELFSWGDNTFKQLGYKTKEKFVTKPHKVEFEGGVKIEQASCARSEKHVHNGCVDENGQVWMWGDPYKGQ